MAGLLSDHELQETFGDLGFVTCSPNVISVLRRARKAAEVSDITVLLEGETGTGKQVLADAIHKLDQKRNSASFITVHCSTISEALAESELFFPNALALADNGKQDNCHQDQDHPEDQCFKVRIHEASVPVVLTL